MQRKVQGSLLLLMALVMIIGCTDKNSRADAKKPPEYVFTYAENQAEDYPTTLAAYHFAELVYERSDGRIKINVHVAGELGDEVSVVEQLRFGGIDFARVSIMTVGDFVSQINVLQLPYLFRDSEHMWSVLNGAIGQEFMDCLEESQIKGLSWYDAGSRSFYLTGPIVGITDLKGKHIRVAKSTLMEDLVTALGAIPHAMDYGDVYSALERHVIDGAENNWPSYDSTDHYKVAPYMMLDSHNRIPELQMMSLVTWQKLSEKDREIIKECALESSRYQQELWKQREQRSRRKVEESGVITVELTEKELQKFRDAVIPIYEKYGAGYEEYIRRIQEEISKEIPK